MLRPLILTGGPAVGKTTSGRALAAARPRAAYIDGDDVRQLVVAGDATLWSGPEGRAQHALGARNVAAMATNMLAAGFTVTASDVVTAETLEVYRAALPDAFVVHLAIRPEAARARAATRPAYLTPEEFDLLHRMTATPPAVDLVLDVSDLSEQEQLAQIDAAWTAAGHASAATRLPPMPERLQGATVVLRPFRDDDAGMAQRLARDPYVPLTGTLPAGATEDEALRWIERQHGRLGEGVGWSFAIADAVDGRALGQIGLWARSLRDGRLTAGYAVDPSARGSGAASVALRLVSDFAWTLPGAHRIELFIEPWNTASIRTAEHAGFHREGLLRSHQVIGGERRDMLLYALLRPDDCEAPRPDA
ncbi:GNAT family N-acetyltransferase [Curtobacterium sp. MCBA15_001]|uniref:GNAT family N-acetyltransferase n=1 Tax=Curtobacterium sp. MCBA15_001 TaxID=1898731 RepID=UPI000AB51027|nr:GNAT family protein [Curtobacterium sp. MCBA15_001]